MLNVHVQFTIISSIMNQGLTDWGLIRGWECNKPYFSVESAEKKIWLSKWMLFHPNHEHFITLWASNKPSIYNRGNNGAIFKISPSFFIYTIFWMKLHPFWNLILVTDSTIIFSHLWGSTEQIAFFLMFLYYSMYGVITIGKLNPISNCCKETLALYLAKRLMVKCTMH